MSTTSHPTLYRRYVTDRHALPLRIRVGFTLAAVACLHLLAFGLLASARSLPVPSPSPWAWC